MSDLHTRLRAATREDHERLERRVDILNRIGAPGGRRELVTGFWRLHAELEAAVAPWLADVPGLDFEARRRTAVLRRDLDHLGLAAPATGRAPPVHSVAEALGLMYVLEGSTLGGKVIRRQVEAVGDDMSGLTFLDPYGPDAGARWRSFLAVLDRAAGAAPEGAIAGARAGFGHAELRLCEATADV